MNKNYRVLYLGQNQAIKSVVGLDKLIEVCPEHNYFVIIGGRKRIENEKKSLVYGFYKRFYDDFKADLRFRTLEDFCQSKNIPYIFSEDPRNIELTPDILSFSPDFLVSNGWGWIIPNKIIDFPKIKALNCHSSLLPLYKGASVYRHVLMNFEKKTGLSVHELTPEIDQGAIYVKREVPIDQDDTPSSLLYKLSLISGEVIKDAFEASVNKAIYLEEDKGFYVKKSSLKDYVKYRTINRLRITFGLEPKRFLLK